MLTYEITYIFTVDVEPGESPDEVAAQYLSQEHYHMEPSSVVDVTPYDSDYYGEN